MGAARQLRRLAFGCLAVLAVPAAARAQGMPQLDFANPLTTSQVIWLAVIFTALYLLLKHWALPEMGAVLELRAASIGRDLEAARQAKQESDVAVAELTEATRRAHAEAQAEIAHAVGAAQAATAAASAKVHARLDAQVAEAESRIQAARHAALGAVRQVATETALEVVLRLTGRPAAPDAVAAAVGETLAARGQA